MHCRGGLLFFLSFTIGQAWGLQDAAALAPLPTPTHPYPPNLLDPYPPPNNDDALKDIDCADAEACCRLMSPEVLEGGLPTDNALRAWLKDPTATATELGVEETDMPEHLRGSYRD
ncbi:hypothetical protein PG985_006393 [Apiospora marii]|uniref:Uncharacterized protein n=1 Tax=Apiospora marii TaxID=335849 RepID=A0ABR1S7G7_9PEZI